ncbi:hypothetical protein FS749_000224 [Ceratobasidium sp. UAMH 11750]|nr:hypothetical protein FS749_000224 [Ceratobasidium sp. UAMH 11750]
MPPSSDEEFLHTRTPSQFAHLKPAEPLTTASGVTPGQAIFDTPPPDCSPSPVLERSQRSRKPSSKKAEASQQGIKKSKPKQPTKITNKNGNHANAGGAGHASTSKSVANTGARARDTNVAIEGATECDHDYDPNQDPDPDQDNISEDEGEDTYVSQTIINGLKRLVGHNVSHLSNRKIKDLLKVIPQTQASTLETQGEPAEAVAKSFTGVGLAGRDRERSPLHEDSDHRSQLTRQGAAHLPAPQKRQISTAGISLPASKRVRLAADEEDDSATQSETEEEDWNTRRRADTSDSDSDSNTESQPPTTASQVKPAPRHPATIPKTANPKPAPPPSQSSTRAQPSASTKTSNPPVVPKHVMDPTSSYLAAHPLPDLDDIDGLAVWALRFAEEQAQALDQGRPIAGPSRVQEPGPSTTADHIARSIANHRSRLNGNRQPSSQDRPAQSTRSSNTPRDVPNDDEDADPEDEDVVALPCHRKPKRSKKAKLSDFPGLVGEIASAAIPKFLATVLTEGSYENPETLRDWALDAYKEIFKVEASEHKYEAPPKALLTVMTRRASWIRGKIRERIRAIIEYGYGFRNPPTNCGDVKHNRRLARKLKPSVFHCRDLKTDSDQYEHPQLARAIMVGFFWDADAIGVAFSDRFNPIPVPAVALVLTMMQACIAEWELGYHKALELDIDTQQADYERHLLGEWFKEAMKRCSALDTEHANAGRPYTLACNVRPDTPPPESEDGPMDTEQGDN